MLDHGGQSGAIVPLPSLGADMDVGTVLEWRVSIGDHVERGDVIALVSTEKSDIDIESWDSGVVTELVASIGEEIAVGQPLLRLGGSAEATGGGPTGDGSADLPPEIARALQTAPPIRPSEQTASRRPMTSPLARRMAAERGVSLEGIKGTGPQGAIIAADLEIANSGPRGAPSSAPPSDDRMRQAIAERMTRSNSEIPHYHLERDIDMTPSLAWLATHNAGVSIAERLVPAALLACASAHAARVVGRLNGNWVDGRLEITETIDLALVISLRSGGLVTPTVVDADQLSPAEMMATMRDMVTGARKGQLRSRWMAPSSIAITNLGDNGADRVGGMIFPPHVALVGFGRISQRPWVVDDEVIPRHVVTASLAADHRATDGAEGSRFLAVVAEQLGHPESIGR